MENLTLEGSAKTPTVNFDGDNGVLELKGRSIPENATSFYKPFLDWIEEYRLEPQPETTLTFFLDYLNSISQKIVYDILDRCTEIEKKSKVKVVWKYLEDDEEIMDEGTVFKSKVGLDFVLEEVPEED